MASSESTGAENIIGQCYIAFGQGLGSMRVSRNAVEALRERYLQIITPEVLEQWDIFGSQVLERVRAVGRMAALRAASAGRTCVDAIDFIDSSRAVEDVSMTPLCLGSGF